MTNKGYVLFPKRRRRTIVGLWASAMLTQRIQIASGFMTTTTTTTSPFLVTSRPPMTTLHFSSASPENINDTVSKQEVETKKKSTEPITPVFVSAIQKLMAAGNDPQQQVQPAAGMAAVTAAVGLALLFSPLSADAAMSGGRMGGSFPSSSRQSYTRPAPSSSSYGQGFRSGYGAGYGSGYYSRPSVTIAPFVSPFGGISPFYRPFPSYYGGPGVITYNRGPSLFDFLIFGGIGLFILSFIRSAASGVADVTASSSLTSSWLSNDAATSALGSGTSVVQITLALDVPRRDDPSSILSVLNRLSKTSRTDSRVGIQNLTSQVALELLRRKSSIISGSTRYKHFTNRDKAQRDFNSVAIQERGKFEQETVSKYGGVDYSSGALSRSSSLSDVGSQATVAVVTILMAIDGDSTKVPVINSMKDVEEALRKIASDAKVDSCLQTAEILWTPEDRSETLTLRDVVADYPTLRSV